MNSVPYKKLLLNVPLQPTKYRKKEFCVDNKVRETIWDVYCPTCRSEKCVYISTNKTTSVYDCKKCKACCHVFNIPPKDQKPTVMLFRGDSTHCFAKKTSRDYEKEKPSPFLMKFLRQSDPSTSEPESKRISYSIYGMIVSTPHWLIQLIKTSFIHFQSTLKQHAFLSVQRRFWVISRFWTRFSISDCERCLPRNDTKFSWKSSGSLELVVISKTRLF